MRAAVVVGTGVMVLSLALVACGRRTSEAGPGDAADAGGAPSESARDASGASNDGGDWEANDANAANDATVASVSDATTSDATADAAGDAQLADAPSDEPAAEDASPDAAEDSSVDAYIPGTCPDAGCVFPEAGAFAAAAEWDVGLRSNAQTVGVADFNGDGLLDAVAADDFNWMGIGFNQGGGNFGAYDAYVLTGYPRSLGTGDFDGDGTSDVAVVSVPFPSCGGQLDVFLNTGDAGVLGGPLSYSLVGAFHSLAVADFNGDHRPDLALSASACNDAGAVVQLLLNTGDGGSIGAPRSFATGADPYWVVSADFDRDGWPDVATADYAGGNGTTVSVLRNAAGAGFDPARSYAVAKEPAWLAAGDLDGDGAPDLVVSSIDGNAGGVLDVLFNTGDGAFLPYVAYDVGQSGAVALADFNRDGSLDVALGDRNGNMIGVLLNAGNGALGPMVTYPVCSNGTISAVPGVFEPDAGPGLALTVSQIAELCVLPSYE
jgi:hypothetical protein